MTEHLPAGRWLDSFKTDNTLTQKFPPIKYINR